MLLSYPAVWMKISNGAIACQDIINCNWRILNKESRYPANTLKENIFVFNIFKECQSKKRQLKLMVSFHALSSFPKCVFAFLICYLGVLD